VDGPSSLRLGVGDDAFLLSWAPAESWSVEVQEGWVSPSYGVKRSASRVVFYRDGALTDLSFALAPATSPITEALRPTSIADVQAN
jgi:hypothetical protein